MAASTALGLAIAICIPAQGATPTTKRVSLRSNGNQVETGIVGSTHPSMSANGRFVAFQSDASDFFGNVDNGENDVFVHDRKTDKTTRVSVRSNGDQAEGGPSSDASISATGRFVAFASEATNLVGNDDNGESDVFVHDRETDKTRRVSVRSNGDQAEGGRSSSPSISANGRFVAFTSEATNVVGNDDNLNYDTFVHDRETDKTTRVSVRSNGDQAENGDSARPSIAANGRFVAFVSDATNLVGNDDNGENDVFVHDRETDKTTRVSVRSNGNQTDDGQCSEPSISANGRIVAFQSNAIDLVGNDDNGENDVFVHDRETKKTTRVSVRSNGDQGEGGESVFPSISGNGRFVAFHADATNLAFGGDDNGYSDVFVHDRETKKTTRVSVRYNGDQAENGHSYNPTVSGSGRFVAFQSVVPLVSNDTNDLTDIFVRGPLR